MEKKLLKTIFILAGVSFLVVITFFLTKPSTPKLPSQNQLVSLDQELIPKEELISKEQGKSLSSGEDLKSLGEDIYEKSSSNPVEFLPQLNPFEQKINPFEGIKTNPFE